MALSLELPIKLMVAIIIFLIALVVIIFLVVEAGKLGEKGKEPLSDYESEEGLKKHIIAPLEKDHSHPQLPKISFDGKNIFYGNYFNNLY